ncbi:cupin domain-containing protein [Hydrogenophaga sp. YM1]|uniref:cupin domain-containing protein n=1 Tax=Hydrogenophaga sp. YM1 TaxID=2806262 RepID=UPI001EF5D9DF|nr:cupin domain-containing protein [Hydrogenophaga sp. YM1]
MSVIDQSIPEATPSRAWRTPHDEVVLCHAGAGELHIDGEVQRFGAGQSVVLPREKLHQVFSVGATPLELTGVFGQTPVPVRLPDGQALEQPWRS